MISFDELAKIIDGEVVNAVENTEIRHLFTDSRALDLSEAGVFFAIHGLAHNGHDFIETVLKKGCLNFVVEEDIPQHLETQGNFIRVKDSLAALQRVASHHRKKFGGKLVAITGSNGKTIVKEWLYALLDPLFLCVKAPMSYNSQLGVPLSVWQIEERHQYAIMEAGISKLGEMEILQEILSPDIGIFTTIGEAHQEGFETVEQKVSEKAKLFAQARKVIYCRDHDLIHNELCAHSSELITWGVHEEATCLIVEEELVNGISNVQVMWNGQQIGFQIPFQAQVMVENIMHCITLLLSEGIDHQTISKGVAKLDSLPMRLQVSEGYNGNIIIDDSYNNDLTGFRVAINQLGNYGSNRTATIIISDMYESGIANIKLYTRLNEIVNTQRVSAVIGIGEEISAYRKCFTVSSEFYPSTEAFLAQVNLESFKNQIILVKGARPFGMERIVRGLQKKAHGTVLEINLNQVTRNINYFRSALKGNVKIMAVIKALAYGSGSVEMAHHLLRNGIDYFSVAYVDEGIFLRKQGIQTPIMVMNPPPDVFHLIDKYNLEPEVYSLEQLSSLCNYPASRPIGIHIKIETGMNRLGFSPSEIPELKELLRLSDRIQVKSIFSHLAASEAPNEDEFTRDQASILYQTMLDIRKDLDHRPFLHLLNSGGITRFPEFQFDMVRLGIGMYGYSPNPLDLPNLHFAQTLKTFVSQVKKVKKGDTVGYGREGVVDSDGKIATLAVGYADGYNRALGNGKGHVVIKGKSVPVIGNVCMDMTMIDVTGLEVKAGDEVILFGQDPSIDELAATLDTIPYEILSRISERVKRIYVYE